MITPPPARCLWKRGLKISEQTLKQLKAFSAMFKHTHTDTDLHTHRCWEQKMKTVSDGCWPKRECVRLFLYFFVRVVCVRAHSESQTCQDRNDILHEEDELFCLFEYYDTVIEQVTEHFVLL